MAVADIIGKAFNSMVNSYNSYSHVGPERTPAQKAHRYLLDANNHIMREFLPPKDLPQNVDGLHQVIDDMSETNLNHYARAIKHLNDVTDWAHKRDIKVDMGKAALNTAVGAVVGGLSIAASNALMNKISDIAHNHAKKMGWSKEKEEEVTKTASLLVQGVFNKHYEDSMRELCSTSENIYLGKNTVF